MRPTLCRLEYLTPAGWAVGHAGIALLNPQRYVTGLAEKGKFGRVIVLDDRLQPTGEVFQPDNLPDPNDLVPSDTVIPMLAKRGVTGCPECGGAHDVPFGCLL